MVIVEKSVLIAHSVAHMFNLVDRVEDYPQFLPWCGGTTLIERTETKTTARIDINYHGLKTHFATENTNEPPYKIDIALCEGPFNRLEGGWRFIPLGESACKIEFRLCYEFSNRLLEAALGSVFGHIAESFIESFVKRASQLVDSH